MKERTTVPRKGDVTGWLEKHGHGRVYPRRDGFREQCQGAPACRQCYAERSALLKLAARRETGNKYNAIRNEASFDRAGQGYSFDSGLERALFLELDVRVKAGELAELRHHEKITLTVYGRSLDLPAELRFETDFSAVELASGERHYFESKGVDGPRWSIIQALWPIAGPGPMHVYRGQKQGRSKEYALRCVKTIVPKTLPGASFGI